MQQYQIIGTSFMTGRGGSTKMNFGPVVASRDAFYLVVNISHNQAMFGLLGGIVDRLEGSPQDLQSVTVTTVGELPEEVTAHPDWPRKIVAKRNVIIVPRSMIREIRRPGLGGQLVLETDAERFSIGLKLFGKRKALSWLREDMGWDCP